MSYVGIKKRIFKEVAPDGTVSYHIEELDGTYTAEETADRDAEITEAMAEKQTYLDAIAGLSEADIKRYNIKQRLISGWQKRDVEVLDRILPYIEKYRRISGNETLKIRDLTPEQKETIINYIVEDIYDMTTA